MKKTIVTTMEVADLKGLLKDCMQETMNSNYLSQPTCTPEKQILSRKETAEMLGISMPTLHSYTQQGIVKAYRLGSSIRYRLDDIYSSLVLINVGRVSC